MANKKKQKKKNMKVRRQVRRTVAAILMIMAIVVAAIPVERYGSMQATGVSKSNMDNLDLMYEDYMSYMDSLSDSDLLKLTSVPNAVDALDYGKIAPDREVDSDGVISSLDQYGSGSPILSYKYGYKAGSRGYVIVKSDSNAKDVINIPDQMYKDYWVITPKLVQETFADVVSAETFKIVATVDETTSCTFEVESVSHTLTVPSVLSLNFNGIGTIAANTSMDLNSAEDNYYGDYNNEKKFYNDTYGITSFTFKDLNDASTPEEIVRAYFPGQVSAAESSLASLQTTFNDMISKSGQAISTEDYNRYNDAINSITNPISEFSSSDMGSDNLLKYFCQRMSVRNMQNSKDYNLKDFELVEAVDVAHEFNSPTEGTDAIVYIPKLKSDATGAGYTLDDNNYLVTQQISIIGIGNEAFAGNNSITEVNLGENIQFIGNSAFENCTSLKNIYIPNCYIVGNRAFKNCALESIALYGTGETGREVYTLKKIGTEAFAGNKGLRDITFPGSLTDVGPGAFANCNDLENFYIGDTTRDAFNIWPFAFYNCVSLKGENFFSDKDDIPVRIGLAAFAVNADNSESTNNMEEFKFPNMEKGFINKSQLFEQQTNGFATFIGNGANKDNYVSNKYSSSSDYIQNVLKDSNYEFMYDYILAGRRHLKHVVFSPKMGQSTTKGATVKIPDNTLAGCNNLEYVTMGEISFTGAACNAVTYDTETVDSDDDGETLFQDIRTTNFYVEGPGYYNPSKGDIAAPRKATRTAETYRSAHVPYKFLDVDPENENNYVTYIEDTDASNKYIATLIDENGDKETAILVSYSRNEDVTAGSTEYCRLTIPGKVGDYSIIGVAPKCFDAIKDKVVEFIIDDGAQIAKIDDEAFKDCTKLLQVKLGNGVQEIGTSAFAGCTSLENVYFSEPLNVSSWEEAMIIGEDAFMTGSEYLTFHGVIHEGYAPFEYAMNSENTLSQNSKRNICYKSVSPTNLTVLVDRSSDIDIPTLIDYPHYEDIDIQNADEIKRIIEEYKAEGITEGILDSGYSILTKWECIQGYNNVNTDYNNFTLRKDEEEIVSNTLAITLPSGVKSMDSKNFFQNTKNSENKGYLNLYYTDTGAGLSPSDADTDEALLHCIKRSTYNENAPEQRNINRNIGDYRNIEKLYSAEGTGWYDSTDLTNQRMQSGLFSSYFEDKNLKVSETADFADGMIGQEYEGHRMIEEVTSGNDHLRAINLTSVQKLPDYAFNSCENLLSVDVGPECKELGITPFFGCTSLTGITGNDTIVCENGIIYTYDAEADTYALSEVLPARGKLVGQPEVNDEYDPLLSKVSSIAPDAFAYNKNISAVDLRTTSITKVPQECFEGAAVHDVWLPATVDTIDDNAFMKLDNPQGTNVYFGSGFCSIADSAFKDCDGKITIIGDKYTDSSETHNSSIYSYYLRYASSMEFKEGDKTYTVKFYDFDADFVGIMTITIDREDKTGTGGTLVGKTSEIEEKLTRAGYTFTGWAWDKDANLNTKDDIVTGDEALNKILEDRVLVAQYKLDGSVSDGKEYNLIIKNGSGIANGVTIANNNSTKVVSNTQVTITANTPATNYSFAYWKADVDNVTFTPNSGSSTATFAMPVLSSESATCTVTAYYKDKNGNISDDPNSNTGNSSSGSGGGSSGGGSGSGGSSNKDDEGEYKLTVNYGSGSGKYDAGESVKISAYAPESSNKVFSHWSTTTSEVTFASSTSAITTLIMPKKDATVTANYKTRSSSDDDDDDDDDDDSWNKRHNSSTSTANRNVNTGTTTNNGTNANQGTTNAPAADSGTRLDIKSNGISNKDVGSVNVSGSTDNFVIKISDSAEAKAAVEAALIDKYGSLDGLAYFPMDISLYDATGKNKITDTDGISVSITIPIPDELIQYGGNNLAGAVNRGNKMEDLVARFTTIDGIGCITFTATHFSPYAVYADTNNLVAGQTMDATPKTGDGIHPKWFLAMALACMSITLFIVSDKKKTRVSYSK